MLNTKLVSNTNLTFNSPASSIIQKSHDKSLFRTMHYNSKLSETVFSDEPKLHGKNVTILQVLLMSEGQIMVELIWDEL